MDETENNAGPESLPPDEDEALHARILHSMEIAILLAVIVSLLFAPWRVTGGFVLGGLLSLFNYHWMCASISSALRSYGTGRRPRLKLAQYVLRYFVIGVIVYLAYRLKLVSLPATIAGLCSFVVAIFVEGFRQAYRIVIHGEDVR